MAIAMVPDPDGAVGATAYVAQCATEALEGLRELALWEGISLESVTAADFAWSTALTQKTGAGGRGVCAVMLTDGMPHVRLLAVEHGGAVALRRLPVDADEDVLADAIGELAEVLSSLDPPSVPVLSLGDPEFRQSIHGAAETAGCHPLEPRDLIAELDYSPETVAAAFAGHGPRFVPTDVRAAARARNGRRGILAAAAAVMLLVTAAAMDALDLNRELAAVRNARSTHAAQVFGAIQARSATTELASLITALAASRTQLPRWTTLVTALSERLPTDAHLIALRGIGDSVHVELEGPDASVAFDALRGIPWLTGFRAVAPIRRDVGEGTAMTERFNAAATISWATLNAPPEER